ncbi:hypothetical protein ACFYOG_16760 [Streptomyces sp. NPDC007818]|uniref:hypothetical protein n=1 Tax=Streptomyces sp. NPDC007818 TaxID=3364780 RepID=UPI0036C425B0
MHIAVVLEVRQQIVLRVPPPVRPRHPDLPPPQRVPQRREHAQLVRDALDPAALTHHRLRHSSRTTPPSGIFSASSKNAPSLAMGSSGTHSCRTPSSFRSS